MRRTLGIVVLLGVGFAACTSPEATRVRADGRGGDVGNHKAVVAMHEGSDPFWKTPRVAGIKGPDLDTARQADHLSRR